MKRKDIFKNYDENANLSPDLFEKSMIQNFHSRINIHSNGACPIT